MKPKPILQLEEHLNLEMEQVKGIHQISEYEYEPTARYYLNPKGQVTGLSLQLLKLQDIAWLKDFTSLEVLNLDGNQLADLRPLQGLKKLTALYLHHNQLTDVGPLQGLKQLKELGLSGNQLSDVGPLQGLKQLKKLYLHHNKITELGPLQGLNQLTDLSLDHNQLTDVGPLQGLNQLTWLNLSINQLSDVGALAKLDKLEFLYLGGNPKLANVAPLLQLKHLRTPSKEIIAQGPRAVMAAEARMGGQPLNEVKVLLVGHGEAGKTSLSKRLRGEDFNAKESQTHSINIHQWRVTLEEPDGELDEELYEEPETITTHLWDFGGQEVMHATHLFFLSTRSLYVLVLDSRREEKAEYWLKHIRSFGGSSPVLVVLNKQDENPGFDVNRASLQRKYPNIKGFYGTDCKGGMGIAPLKAAITQTIAGLPIRKEYFPENWVRVKNALVQRKGDHMPRDTYRKLCAKNKIEDFYTQDLLLSFLNQLGIALYYKQDPNRLIFNPEWLTTAVYKLITATVVAQRQGHLYRTDLPDLLPSNYHPEHYNLILGLMVEFEICYALTAGQEWLIPDLLPVEENTGGFDGEAPNGLRFYFQYDFLPRSIFPRFLVQRHTYLKGSLRWRTGCVLQDPDTQTEALIITDYEARQIHMTVTGIRSREFFAVLRRTFNDMHATFHALGLQEMVPVPGYPGAAFAYKELVDHEQLGVATLKVPGHLQMVKVKDLLQGIEAPEPMTGAKVGNQGGKQPPTRDQVFISYAHAEGKPYRDLLKAQLGSMAFEEHNTITYWDDTQIQAGEKWREAIENQLRRTKVAVFLVGPDFLTSPFIQNTEIPELLEGASKVIPVIIRRCRVQQSKLGIYQAINPPDKPLAKMPDPEIDDIMYEVTEAIEQAMKEK